MQKHPETTPEKQYITLEMASELYQKATTMLPEGNQILNKLAIAIEQFALALQRSELIHTEQSFAELAEHISQQTQTLHKTNAEIFSTYGEKCDQVISKPIASGSLFKSPVTQPTRAY